MSADENFEAARAIFDMDRYEADKRSELELKRMHAERDVKIEQAKARTARWNAIGVFLGFVGFAIVCGVIAFFIWNGVKGPSAEQQSEERKSIACSEAGGTWIGKIDTRESQSPGICVAQGAKVAG